MSIEMTNPQTAIGKIDAAANYLEQMFLAKSINDNTRFAFAHKEAGRLLFEAMQQLEKDGEGVKTEDVTP